MPHGLHFNDVEHIDYTALADRDAGLAVQSSSADTQAAESPMHAGSPQRPNKSSLLGAVVGLWPFQRGVAPAEGDVVKGRVLSAEEAGAVPPEDWRVEVFSPGAAQVAGALWLIGLGFGVTMVVARIGRERPEAAREAGGED